MLNTSNFPSSHTMQDPESPEDPEENPYATQDDDNPYATQEMPPSSFNIPPTPTGSLPRQSSASASRSHSRNSSSSYPRSAKPYERLSQLNHTQFTATSHYPSLPCAQPRRSSLLTSEPSSSSRPHSPSFLPPTSMIPAGRTQRFGSYSPAPSDSSLTEQLRNSNIEELLWIPSVFQLYQHCSALKESADYAHEAVEAWKKTTSVLERVVFQT